MKKCPKCQTSTDNFNKNKAQADGLDVYCRPCKRQAAKESRLRNLDKHKARARSYYQKHREQLLLKCKSEETKQRRRDYYQRNKQEFKDNVRWAQLKRLYGISKEEYANLLSLQNGRCAICHKFSDLQLHVDHCHTTGKIRGLLCVCCNRAIGFFKDSTESLQNAIDYLNRAKQ